MQIALVLLSILALVLIARTEPHDVYELAQPRGDDPPRRDL
jgi:hypothetical protein